MFFLNKIVSSIRWFGLGIKQMVGLIVPFVTKARDLRGIRTTTRWVLRIILLVLLTGLCYWISKLTGLGQAAPPLYNFWLPVLVLLIIGIAWVGRWVYSLFYTEAEESPFPDIDAAWEEAITALLNARIDPTEVPLFLVLGRAAGTEESLFAASKLSLAVKGAPSRPDAPVRVFANRDGIFVTCAGASLLGCHASILHTGTTDDLPPDVRDLIGQVGEAMEDPNKTMAPGGQALEVLQIIRQAREQGRGPEDLTDDERQQVNNLKAAAEDEENRRTARSRTLLTRNVAASERLEARFRHLCRLIVHERRPFCPLNGILLTIPVAASDTDDDARAAGSLCQKDLQNARAVLKVHCPVVALLTDMERLSGFTEFMNRFTDTMKDKRVGQRFPFNPDLEGTNLESKLAEVAQWIGQSLVPSWVHRLFRVEHQGSDTMEAAVAGNIELYQFMDAMRKRQGRLGRILAAGVTPDGSGPMLFGGCYLAGTGSSGREQAFVKGVFDRMFQEQNYVSWTREALAEEDQYSQWTRWLYLSLAVYGVVLVLATAALIKYAIDKR